jgi:hypothetical protein
MNNMEFDEQYQKEVADLRAEVVKLRKFKEYVHKRLDELNVPSDPDPVKNEATGCRVECRFTWLSRFIDMLNKDLSYWKTHASVNATDGDL